MDYQTNIPPLEDMINLQVLHDILQRLDTQHQNLKKEFEEYKNANPPNTR